MNVVLQLSETFAKSITDGNIAYIFIMRNSLGYLDNDHLMCRKVLDM